MIKNTSVLCASCLFIFVVCIGRAEQLVELENKIGNIPKKYKNDISSEEKKNISLFELEQKSIHPGEVIFLHLNYDRDEIKNKLFCDNKFIPSYFDQSGKRNAYLAESYFSENKKYKCHLEFPNNQFMDVAEITVAEINYPSERLRVDKRRVSLSSKNSRKVLQEKDFLESIYSASPNIPLFDLPFVIPSKNKVTSVYGTKRVFNKKNHTQHLGTDFRARIGDPVYAANSGKVVVAGKLFYTGNTVVIDHGLGIFTIYGHLSKIVVKQNQNIKKMQLIAKAGATGRVTGPHLHWGIKVNNLYVEGKSIVVATKHLNSIQDDKILAMTPSKEPNQD